MGPEVALASTLISTATASAGTAASTSGLLLSSLGTIGSAFMGYQQQRAAGKAAQIASEQQAAEIRLQQAAETAQNAEEQAALQRRLRRQIAMQRASFAAGGVTQEGTPNVINEQTTSEFQRSMDAANLRSGLAVKSLNRQAMSVLRGGINQRKAYNSKATTSLISGLTTFGNQMQDYNSVTKSSNRADPNNLDIQWVN